MERIPDERVTLPQEVRDAAEVYRASQHMLTKNASEVALGTEVKVVPSVSDTSIEVVELHAATDEEHEA